MTIFILSLAGIPGTAGFIGKINIFLGALHVEACSLRISFYYDGDDGHFICILFPYFTANVFPQRERVERKLRLPLNIKVVMSLCAISIVILGIMPMIGYNFFYEHFPLMKRFLLRVSLYNSGNKRCGVRTSTLFILWSNH